MEATVTGAITCEGDSIYLKTGYHNMGLARLVLGGRYDKKKEAFRYPKTPTAAAQIAARFGELDHDDEFRELLEAYRRSVRAQKVKRKNYPLPPVPVTRFPAWDHQLRAFWFAYGMPASMLALGMGCGKTKVTIDLIQNRKHPSVLILCPKSVIDTWVEEYPKHAADGVPYHIEACKKGTVKQKKEVAEMMMNMCRLSGKRFICVINYESAWREPFGSWAKQAGFDLVVCDESHKIKSPSGKASRFAEALGKVAPYRLCLTGTPMPNNPLDIYGQYRFLDRAVFGTNYSEFKTRYAVWKKFDNGGEAPTQFINQEELNRKMYSIAIRYDSDDVLDLPEAIHMKRYTELEPKARKAYREMEKEFYALVDEGEVTAANAAVKILRLQQITSGLVKDDTGQMVEVSKAKRELLAETLDGLDTWEPVVVFCRFQQDLDAVKEIAEGQGRRCAELSGRMNQLAEWKAGEYDVIAVQIQAGGAGVNLTRAAYVVYYSTGHSLGDYEQSLKRSHRPGQTRPVRFYHLIVKGTVDEAVYEALQNKKDVVEYVLERREG